MGNRKYILRLVYCSTKMVLCLLVVLNFGGLICDYGGEKCAFHPIMCGLMVKNLMIVPLNLGLIPNGHTLSKSTVSWKMSVYYRGKIAY